jgi:hypothetical protein
LSSSNFKVAGGCRFLARLHH